MSLPGYDAWKLSSPDDPGEDPPERAEAPRRPPPDPEPFELGDIDF